MIGIEKPQKAVLIYDESELGISQRDRFRGAGKQAFIRNAEAFDPTGFDANAELVITNSEVIRDAYEAKGIEVVFEGRPSDVKAVEAEAEPVSTETEAPFPHIEVVAEKVKKRRK
jgi:hypothetical protein